MERKRKIAIVGGGPGGLMLARLLHLRGETEISVLERDTHPGERPQGGSLDLHGETGQRAMKLAGLDREFRAAARPEDQGDRLYDRNGVLLFDQDGAEADRPEIDRSVLRDILLASLPDGTVRWSARVGSVEPTSDGRYGIELGDGSREAFDIVVGADGAWSRVRALLTDTVPSYEGATLVEIGFQAARLPGIAALVGSGKMFAVGDERLLIGQRNGHGHIRAYAGFRHTPDGSRVLAGKLEPELRAFLDGMFHGWAPNLRALAIEGEILAVRPLYALPAGDRWPNRPGVTLIGDASHLMSPFSGEGVNLALADAVDLADALASANGWAAVERYEETAAARARPAAEGAAGALRSAFGPNALTDLLAHYRERMAG